MASRIVGGWRENNEGENNWMQIHARKLLFSPPLFSLS